MPLAPERASVDEYRLSKRFESGKQLERATG
jgi:hypothetical protein